MFANAAAWGFAVLQATYCSSPTFSIYNDDNDGNDADATLYSGSVYSIGASTGEFIIQTNVLSSLAYYEFRVTKRSVYTQTSDFQAQVYCCASSALVTWPSLDATNY